LDARQKKHLDKKKLDELPLPEKYVTVARFPEDLSSWEKGAWSVVLEIDPDSWGPGPEVFGTATFLVEEAPWEILRPGVRFEMLEGNRVTATVKILKS